jgi:MOSC domain-containing protein YiiM
MSAEPDLSRSDRPDLVDGGRATSTGKPDRGAVTAICVVHQVLPDSGQDPDVTAIDKRPVSRPVDVGVLGLVGDTQCDRRNHGGRDQAVYAYADADAAWWAEELGQEITPGLFGENLRLSGIDVSGAVVGERWRIGDEGGVVVEVTGHRTPCVTFQNRMGIEHWVRRFAERRLPGAYLRVITPGSIHPDDPVTVITWPAHGVTVADISGVPEPALMVRLLAAADAGEVHLAPVIRQHAARAAARA